MSSTPRMTAGQVRYNPPRPARPTWQPIELTRPGWEVEASRKWQRMPEVERVPAAYTGTSRLRAKANARRRQEAGQ